MKQLLKKTKRLLWPYKNQRQWSRMLKKDKTLWNKRVLEAKGGPKILIATSAGGSHGPLQVESLLAVALTLRGANVHFLLCDKALPACSQPNSVDFNRLSDFAEHGPRRSICDNCFPPGLSFYKMFQLPIHYYSEYLTESSINSAKKLSQLVPFEEIKNYYHGKIAIGEHALSGTLRFFAKSSLSGVLYEEEIFRRFF